MQYVLIFFAFGSLATFAWARRAFFVRVSGTPRQRFGLKPLGTASGIGVVLALVMAGEIELSVRTAVAVVLILISQGVFWLAVRSFSEMRPAIAFSPLPSQRLVASGPYRYVRHPFYAAYMIFWLAGFMAAPGLITATALVIMSALYARAAIYEERQFLESELASEYKKYSASTGMFLPRFFVLRRGI